MKMAYAMHNPIIRISSAEAYITSCVCELARQIIAVANWRPIVVDERHYFVMNYDSLKHCNLGRNIHVTGCPERIQLLRRRLRKILIGGILD